FEFVGIAISFAGAATWLRRRYELPLTDRMLLVATMSYTFAPLPLLFGTSWMGFINAQAAWPLAYIAMQFRSATRAIALLSVAFAFALFGGNLHPFGFLVMGSGLWAAYFSWRDRSIRPLLGLAASLLLVASLVYLVLGLGIAEIARTGQVRHFEAAKA